MGGNQLLACLNFRLPPCSMYKDCQQGKMVPGVICEHGTAAYLHFYCVLRFLYIFHPTSADFLVVITDMGKSEEKRNVLSW
jgi:hypothetical protein